MVGFCRNFFTLTTLTNPTTEVMSTAAQKAVELAMLGQIDEASAIFAVLAQHYLSETVEEREILPFNQRVPKETPFFYEMLDTLPPGVGEVDTLPSEEELQCLEKEFLYEIQPHLRNEPPIDIGQHATEANFEKVNSLVQKTLESDGPFSHINAKTGSAALDFSSYLTSLLSISLYLGKTAEADDIMARIASRIHAAAQARNLSRLRPVWKRYFKSGWFRDKLGLLDDELKKYAEFILKVTKKRLAEGPVRPSDLFKDKSFEEMLDELNQNTLRLPEVWEEWVQEGLAHGDESGAVPSTILREPATADEIAIAESRLGCSLPDDLKHFYSLTNGLRAVLSGPYIYMLETPLLRVQELFWEDNCGYGFNLFPEYLFAAKFVPFRIEWPDIECGAIAMYEFNGQGTKYIWYLQGEVLVKAKKALDKAYQEAGEPKKKIIDNLVEQYHGSWEKLRDLQSCWCQVAWGEGVEALFHDFRDFLSHVVYKSRYEKDKSPLKQPEDDL